MLADLKKEISILADQKQAAILSRFFKTGKGEYGEGDKFLGIKVPVQRKLVLKFKDLPLEDCLRLLSSEMHEHRNIALFIMAEKYKRGDEKEKEKIFKAYLKNTKFINNWDLVDLSAPKIIGQYLLNKDRKILYKLARSKNLWERRIAMLSCYAFIRNEEFDDALAIAQILLDDKHDLMHKAVGWMLREVGNRNLQAEEDFLKKHYSSMPRTMLRYAIEKFPEKKRKMYLVR